VRSPRDEAGTPLLTETAVAPLLAELDGWDRRWGRFERVLAGPQGSDRLALVATGDRRPGEVIFLYDRGMLSVLAQLTESRTYALHLSALFSPDARWLALPIASSGPRPSGPERLLLFDLTTGTQVLAPPTTPAPLDWSADGSWLAHWRGDGVLELIAPGWTGAGDQPYRIFALPPFRFEGHGACSGLAWVERE
ncbi:MAG: hypothetical protein R3272_09915, partial [Candidatus Promineifilaceae bacterium]|nr:hypothetical protein [Candidatus Promineifilaceae bacterium]